MDDPVAIPSSTMTTRRPAGSIAFCARVYSARLLRRISCWRADFFAQVLVGHQLEIPALQHGTRLVDRANGQFRLSWGPQFPDQDDIEVAIRANRQ